MVRACAIHCSVMGMLVAVLAVGTSGFRSQAKLPTKATLDGPGTAPTKVASLRNSDCGGFGCGGRCEKVWLEGGRQPLVVRDLSSSMNPLREGNASKREQSAACLEEAIKAGQLRSSNADLVPAVVQAIKDLNAEGAGAGRIAIRLFLTLAAGASNESQKQGLGEIRDVLNSGAPGLTTQDKLDLIRGLGSKMTLGLAVPGFLESIAKVAATEGTKLRLAAYRTLKGAAALSPKVQEVLDTLGSGHRTWIEDFFAAARGDLLEKPEAQELAGRYAEVARWVAADALDGAWPSNGAAYLVFNDSLRASKPQLACAQACAYATGSVLTYATSSDIKRLQDLFTNAPKSDALQRADDEAPCLGFAVFQAQATAPATCALFSALPSKLSSSALPAPAGARLQLLREPSAVVFCAQNVWQLDKAADLKKTEADLVRMCKANLTASYRRSPLEAQLWKNRSVIDSVCAAECTGLAHEMVSGKGLLKGNGRDSLQAESWCTGNVVQKVEAQEFECCGAACGWNSSSKTCAGAHLLSKDMQEMWTSKCCAPSTTLFQSNRHFMCESMKKAMWPESPKTGRSSLLELDTTAQASALASENGGSVCQLQCGTFVEASLLQCSDARRSQWFGTSAAETCAEVAAQRLTESPHACAELARAEGPAKVRVASWTLAERTEGGRAQGLCALHTSCDAELPSMLELRKANIGHSSETLWMVVDHSVA